MMLRNMWLMVLGSLFGTLFVVSALGAMETGRAGEPPSETRANSEEGQADQGQAARKAAIWLVRAHQNADGGYTSFSSGANEMSSTVGGSVDAMLAIAAAGFNPATAFPGQQFTPADYLAANPADVAAFAETDGAQAGKMLLALTAAAVDPRDIGGYDVVAALRNQAQTDGNYGVADVFKQSLAVLGLVAVNEPVPDEAVQWIVDAQAANGAWDDGFGTIDNPDATSMAIMALLAAGRAVDDPVIVAARNFLAGAQLTGATWEYGTGLGGNANSTALVIQALSAMGEVWYDDSSPWAQGSTNPLEALLAFQGPSGAFQADFGQGPFDDFFSTVQVLPAVAGRALPLSGRFEAARQGLSCLESLQDDMSGGWEQFAGVGVNAAGTARALEAIRAAGNNPQDGRWTTASGARAVEHLEEATPDYLAGGRGGRVGIVMQGVIAAGQPYTVDSFAGLDLPVQVSGYLSPSGQYADTAFGISAHAEAMLGLLVSGNPVDVRAVEFLKSAQQKGNWGDADQNGIALNVLGRLKERPPAQALSVLSSGQLPEGGWGYGDEASPSSTSEVVQGLIQMGQNPFGPSWSQVVDGRLISPADVVLGQQTDNGCWPNQFGPGPDPFGTTDAVVMLSIGPAWDVAIIQLPMIAGGGG